MVEFDTRAYKEFSKLPRVVQLEFIAIIQILEESGELREPLGKKLDGYRNLFEMRVRRNGAWRSIYCYFADDKILILCVFQKKSNKTPLNNIQTAIKRHKSYNNEK